MRFQNRLNRFFFGRIDKRAGVHHEHVGFIGARGNFHPTLEHAAEHDLSIDQVFRAAEADHPDLRRSRCLILRL